MHPTLLGDVEPEGGVRYLGVLDLAKVTPRFMYELLESLEGEKVRAVRWSVALSTMKWDETTVPEVIDNFLTSSKRARCKCHVQRIFSQVRMPAFSCLWLLSQRFLACCC